MTNRWIITGAVVGALLAATAGIAYAAGSGGTPPVTTPAAENVLACEAMHDSPGMEAMHAQMSAALQERCDAMHELMDQMMGGSGMMGGSTGSSGMMGGPGMGAGSMAGHHASTEG